MPITGHTSRLIRAAELQHLGYKISSGSWHMRCYNCFGYYETYNKRVCKEETVMNCRELVMSNACRVGHGVRRPEASIGGMNTSRYVSKGVLLLGLSLIISSGLYTLSLSVIGQSIFPLHGHSILTDSEKKVVGWRQTAQPSTKDVDFQPRAPAASYDASTSTSSAVAVSNDVFDQTRQFGATVDPSLRPQKICRFYDC